MGTIQTVWGWQPALYLFLGGMGAGTGLVACILYYMDKERLRKVIKISFWAAAISIIVGLLLLLMELTNPLRGMLLWQSFSHAGSWMTFGAWAAFTAIIVFGLSALCMTIRDAAERKNGRADDKRDKRIAGMMKVFCPLGILLGVAVAAYTGILLMCAEVPFWHTWLLPCLFTVSAIDTGVALVEIVFLANHAEQEAGTRTLERLERAVVVLIPIEAVVLTIFLIVSGVGGGAGAGAAGLAAAASTKTLLAGELGVWFWIVMVGCGLIVPFIAAKSGLKKMHAAEASLMAEAAAVVGEAETTGAAEKPANPASVTPAIVVEPASVAVADAAGKPATPAATGKPANTAAAGAHPFAFTATGASLALVGGCALRFLVLAAGVHADYIATALTNIL